jgi:hypothetical protein
MFEPIFSFRPTTILKAFIINALFAAIITAFTIETRRVIDENKYTKDFPNRPHKLIFTTLVSFMIAFITFIIVRYLIGAGGGMLGSKTPHPKFL